MKLKDQIVVVTGGANGIGKALCGRFAAEGARAIIVVDMDGPGAAAVAKGIPNAEAHTVNVADEGQVLALVEQVIATHGRIDLFCSNAGIGIAGGCEVRDSEWQRIWEVNVMSQVYAARAVLPGMLARKQGYLLQTVSAAGLLTQIGSAPYAVTKHAALSLAEWLAITYGDSGIKVSALCPQGVRTNMLERAEFGGGAFLREGALEPDQVAEAVVKGLEAEQFLILPHPDVAEYFRRKATDYERWLRGMRRLQATVQPLEIAAEAN
ncbi:MAG: SDR family oxidoreductase [Acidobacteriota bacterium]|nr:SDR family oxidoreductase [Acidobacteriota bacterium]